MQNIILRQIEKQFENNTDFVIKKIKINYRTTLYVLYLESVTGSDKVNDYILKNITLLTALKKKSFKDIQSLIPAPHTLILNKIVASLNLLSPYSVNSFKTSKISLASSKSHLFKAFL